VRQNLSSRKPLPPPRPLPQERCYCWDLRLPHVHTLGDHDRPTAATWGRQ
jgi:hypothetical protein